MEESGDATRWRFVACGVSAACIVVVARIAAPTTDLAFALAAVSAVVCAIAAWRLLNQVHTDRQRSVGSDEPYQQRDRERAESGRSAGAEPENGRYYELLVDGVRDYAILMLDNDGHVTSWNAGAERIKGYQRDEIIGQHFSCFYPEEERRSGRPERELEIAQTKGRFEEEGWRVRRDGSRFWANVIVSAMRDEAGTLRGFSKITRDISERKSAADQIGRLNADLKLQVAQLAAANRELEQKNRENEMFVYSVSHDLRSPLVNLQGFSNELTLVCQDLREILVENPLPSDVQTRALALIDDDMGESTQFMQSAVMRLSNIIDALLRLSRVGRVDYRRQELDVQGIVCRVVESLATTITEKNARVMVRDLPPAVGDATAIEQVFANLLSNSLKYLDPERPGVIEVGYVPEAVVGGEPLDIGAFYVRDNGLGIAEDYQSKIFQPFQRVHTGVAPGEGMGLAIIRRILERHGVQIWVESAPGEGAAFFFALPTSAASATEYRRTEQMSATDERSQENGCRTTSHCVGGR